MPYRGLFGRTRRDTVARLAGDGLDKVWRAAGLPSDYRAGAAVAATTQSPTESPTEEQQE